MCKKSNISFALATILLILFIEEYYNKHKSSHKKTSIGHVSKIANQQSQNQSSPTSSQENPAIPTTTQNPQHPHEFVFKITHTHLKNDTLAYPNH